MFNIRALITMLHVVGVKILNMSGGRELKSGGFLVQAPVVDKNWGMFWKQGSCQDTFRALPRCSLIKLLKLISFIAN